MLFRLRVILETDPTFVVQRVALRTDDMNFSEQSVAQVGMQVNYRVLAEDRSSTSQMTTRDGVIHSGLSGNPFLFLGTAVGERAIEMVVIEVIETYIPEAFFVVFSYNCMIIRLVMDFRNS